MWWTWKARVRIGCESDSRVFERGAGFLAGKGRKKKRAEICGWSVEDLF